jgi:hypothetical protein
MPHRTEPNHGAASLIHNPLVASVLRENVRFAGGRALIGLWDGWPFLLSELPVFGPVPRQAAQLVVTEVERLEVCELADFGRQAAQLVVTEVERLEVHFAPQAILSRRPALQASSRTISLLRSAGQGNEGLGQRWSNV